MDAALAPDSAADVTRPGCPVGREDFAAFVGPHWSDMARLARRLAPAGDWEDVLQDALGAAWRKRQQFDPARGSPRVWLLAIVADQARKDHRRSWSNGGVANVVGADDARAREPDRVVDDPHADVDLHAALHRLTARQRAAIELHYYLGLPVTDVARVLDCSAGTVKSTLSDARRRLRHELGEEHRHD